MRIALVTDRFGPGTGTGGQVHLLASSLRLRHEVTVWCRAGSSPMEGVSLNRAPRMPWTVSPAHGIRFSFVRSPGCELIRASGGVHAAYLQACGRFPRPRDLVELGLERAAARRCVRLICNSDRVAREAFATHGISPDRVSIVRNGVDLSRFRPDAERRAAARRAWCVPDGGRVALFLAHGFRRKNLATAVAAFAGVARAEDRLVIGGRDAHADRWLTSARERLGGRVVVVGPTAAPEELLPGADALLHPTCYDASANVVLEALACGVPTVTTVADGAGEIVPDRSLVVEHALDVREVGDALDHAWEAGPGPSWRSAAEQWPESRMVSSLEQVVLEVAGHG